MDNASTQQVIDRLDRLETKLDRSLETSADNRERISKLEAHRESKTEADERRIQDEERRFAKIDRYIYGGVFAVVLFVVEAVASRALGF